MGSRRQLLGIAAVALSAVNVTIGASRGPQTPTTQQVPTFRTRTDIVWLETSVLDKNRRPVRGLTDADFSVLEDGKAQTISVFDAVEVPDPKIPPVAWMRDVTPDVTTNEAKMTRLWVLVVDDAMIPQMPFSIRTSRQIVRDVIEKFGPEDLATIVFTTDSRNAQDFTNDRAKLLATLDKYSPGNAAWRGGLPDPDWQFQLGALLTLRNVMDTLVAEPHSRKGLVWVSPGLPHDFFPPIKQAPLGGSSGTMAGPIVKLRIIELAKEVFEIGRRANVPIYPIDPCGTGGIASCLGGMPNSMHTAVEFLRTTAQNTGGRAILDTNDFGPGINSIFEENESYYLLGYSPTNAKPDGTYRRLEVKVNRKDVEVRTRSSYYAPKPGDGPPKSTNDTLARATASAIPVRELPLRASVAPFAIPGSRMAAVAVALGVRQPVPERAAKERVTVTTELQTSAFNTEGDLKGTQRHSAKVVLRAGAHGDADYEALSRIDLPAGRYRLRLAVFHEATSKTGTVMVDVVVPDFSHDSVSMSGVVLSATPGRPSAPRDLLTTILPVVPTAQRSFTKAERATAFFHLYQDGRRPTVPAEILVRIIDGQGATLITGVHEIAIDRFTNPTAQMMTKSSLTNSPILRSPTPSSAPLRGAEFHYRLPLDGLPPGPYLMSFQSTVGSTVLRRDVQIEVKR